ncbi:cyclin-dependent kinase inhibitor 1Ba isoform 1-T2 [Menidia menidia]
MSDVRLSNASPTVERVDARPPDDARAPEGARPPVRRALFGAPDREEMRRHAEAAVQRGARDFRERYHFDPVADRPLPGPGGWDWEEDPHAPEFYRRPPRLRPREEQHREAGGGPEPPRKRRPDAPGSCNSDRPSKRSRGGEHDDDDEDRSGAQAIPVPVPVPVPDPGPNRGPVGD